ncbi:MAG: hypothetical protein J0M12_10735 [Deltaproteobacteria bacterium]|nr:hypothetical protein [Deltaproteobacteria bacterium]
MNVDGWGVVKELKTLCAGLLAGTLLACLAFPSGIESFSASMAGITACLLSIAATTLVLRLLRWPRVAVEIRLSFVSLGFFATLMSIGLGIFLWRLALRVSELFVLSVATSSILVLTCSAAYFALCYHLLMSARGLQERQPVTVERRIANRDERRVLARRSARRPQQRSAGR